MTNTYTQTSSSTSNHPDDIREARGAALTMLATALERDSINPDVLTPESVSQKLEITNVGSALLTLTYVHP